MKSLDGNPQSQNVTQSTEGTRRNGRMKPPCAQELVRNPIDFRRRILKSDNPLDKTLRTAQLSTYLSGQFNKTLHLPAGHPNSHS
jgi:hypothetical protein